MSIFSESEQHGLDAIKESDRLILSVGISTGGEAEIEMARRFPMSHIIATSIDNEGIEHAKALIEVAGLSNRVEVKFEDVSEKLPYNDGSIDFIYARLVLHYLAKQKLESTLRELARVLKEAGKLYVVARSTESSPASFLDNTYDEATGLTTYRIRSRDGGQRTATRFFHTHGSISGFVNKHFKIEYIKQYDEKLYIDFARTTLSDHQDNLIELLAVKGDL